MMTCLATEANPTVDAFRHGYRWWLSATIADHLEFYNQRFALVRTAKRDWPTIDHYSSGTTGQAKLVKWGPCYDALYHFLMNDFVRDGTILKKVAMLSLLAVRLDMTTRIVVNDTPNHAVAHRWIRVMLGKDCDWQYLKSLLYEHDIIIAPSHLEILEQYAGIMRSIDRRSLILSTAEPPSPQFKQLVSTRRLRDWMRSWDGGFTFFTCRYGQQHIIDMLAQHRVTGVGNLVSSDCFNLTQPCIDYWNGDRVNFRSHGRCACGLTPYSLVFENRQHTRFFLAPDGSGPLFYHDLMSIWAITMRRFNCYPGATLICFTINLIEKSLIIHCLLTPVAMTLLTSLITAVNDDFAVKGFVSVSIDNTIHTGNRKLNRMIVIS